MASTAPRALHIGFGVFSLVLGALPLLAPERVARGVGLRPGPTALRLLRAVGVRELVVGSGLITRRTPAWLWARVAQDAMDVPLAAVTTATKRGEGRVRMARATAFLVAVTAADVAAAIRATRDSAVAGTRR